MKTGRLRARSPTSLAAGCPTTRLHSCERRYLQPIRNWPTSATSCVARPRRCVKLAALGGSVGSAPLRSPVADYYLTNAIARASAVMAECSTVASEQMMTAAE